MATLFGCRKIIILYINLCLQLHDISGQTYLGNSCYNYVNSTAAFESNLNTILSSVSANIDIYGFYNGTVGDGVDQVNAIALCRGDIDIESCRVCINNAARYLTTMQCPNQVEAIICYDVSMFRYSNASIFGTMSLVPAYKLVNPKDAPNVRLLTEELTLFANNLVNNAVNAYNETRVIFASGNTSNADVQTFYGFMQCTPDISSDDCKSCLESVANSLSDCCYKYLAGARWITPSCSFRYETYPFIKERSNPGKRSNSKTVIIVVCVIVVLLVLTIIVCGFITRRRWQNANTGHQPEEDEEELPIGTMQYDFASIKIATLGFSTANMLGRGGFGEVYKGVLSDGKEIAVKRLSTTSGQGEKEFRNEVKLLAKLQHNCLVRLLGFCLERKERLLVYEFMKNGSLDNVLFDTESRSRLDWEGRYKIIKSVAKGLIYLHDDSRLMIIHRDLKASNILLDEEMNAKIADFGMARLFVRDEGEVITNRIAGTFGYMAPEYAMHGLFSVKSDVYSYGILLLEIISGKKNYSSLTEDGFEDLPSWAYKTWKEDKISDVIDPMLTSDSDSLENMMRCIHIALLCVQENVATRPTMAAVVLMLQSLTLTLQTPSEPGFFSNAEMIVPHWSSFSEFPESSSSSGLSKPILVHGARSDRALNVESASHKHLQ